MNLDNALWLAGFVIEGVVFGLLIRRGSWKTLPVFCAYIAWDLLLNGANFVVLHHFSSRYLTIYLVETVIDSALVLSVLVELAWSVLRPIRGFLPRRALAVVGIAVLGVGAAIWPVSGIHMHAQLSKEDYLLAHLQQTVSILRVLFFLLLAGCSQLLAIGWRHRELQVATGLGFYSLVSLGAAMLRSQQTTVAEYSHLNQIVVASYVCSLIYWVLAFAQQEAVRREFTPKMEQFLLSLAGNARAARLAMAGTSVDDKHAGGKP